MKKEQKKKTSRHDNNKQSHVQCIQLCTCSFCFVLFKIVLRGHTDFKTSGQASNN